MKNLAFAFALLAMFMVTGQTQVIKQNGGNPSTVRYSTFTVVGDGSKCFSVDDPTLVVDCILNRVGIGTASPGAALHVVGSEILTSSLTVGGSAFVPLGGAAANGIGVVGTGDKTIMVQGGTSGAVETAMRSVLLLGQFGTTTDHKSQMIQNGTGIITIEAGGGYNTSLASGLTVVGTTTFNAAMRPQIRTKAQFDAITPSLGDTYICSDCTVPYSICTATGTTLSGFRRADSTTAGCGTNN